MGIKIIVKNKKAYHNYFLTEKFEAGLVLKGTEIKSLRIGKVSISEAYVKIDEKCEAWIHNMKIPLYEFGNRNNHEEARKRKLLLHQHEIKNIHHLIMTQRLTVVPTIIYFKQSHVKIEIALAKGKKQHDKRHDQAKKDSEKRLKQGQYE